MHARVQRPKPPAPTLIVEFTEDDARAVISALERKVNSTSLNRLLQLLKS